MLKSVKRLLVVGLIGLLVLQSAGAQGDGSSSSSPATLSFLDENRSSRIRPDSVGDSADGSALSQQLQLPPRPDEGLAQSGVVPTYQGALQQSVPLELPQPRGGLPVPVSIDYRQDRLLGVAGVGWDVPLWFIETLDHSSGLPLPTTRPAHSESVSLSLGSSRILMTPRSREPSRYDPVASESYLDLSRGVDGRWELQDLQGFSYRFERLFEDDPRALLTEIRGFRSTDRLLVQYGRDSVSGGGAVRLERIEYSHLPGDLGCPRHVIELVYTDDARGPTESVGTDEVVALDSRGPIAVRTSLTAIHERQGLLNEVRVSSTPASASGECGGAQQVLSRFGLERAAVNAAGLPLLTAVIHHGGSGESTVLRRYEYASAVSSPGSQDLSLGQAKELVIASSSGEIVPDSEEVVAGSGVAVLENSSLLRETRTTRALLDMTGDGRVDRVSVAPDSRMITIGAQVDANDRLGFVPEAIPSSLCGDPGVCSLNVSRLVEHRVPLSWEEVFDRLNRGPTSAGRNDARVFLELEVSFCWPECGPQTAGLSAGGANWEGVEAVGEAMWSGFTSLAKSLACHIPNPAGIGDWLKIRPDCDRSPPRDQVVYYESLQQAVDWNGDGRIDVVSAIAAESPDNWRVFLNLPGEGGRLIDWRPVDVPVGHLRDRLQEIHGDTVAGALDDDAPIPLGRQRAYTNGILHEEWDTYPELSEEEYWDFLEECRYYVLDCTRQYERVARPDSPRFEALDSGIVTEWSLLDANGDGSMDVVFAESAGKVRVEIWGSACEGGYPGYRRLIDSMPERSRPPNWTLGDPERWLNVSSCSLAEIWEFNSDVAFLAGINATTDPALSTSPIRLNARCIARSSAGTGPAPREIEVASHIAFGESELGTTRTDCALLDMTGDGIPEKIEGRGYWIGVGDGTFERAGQLPGPAPTLFSDVYLDECKSHGSGESHTLSGFAEVTGDGHPDYLIAIPAAHNADEDEAGEPILRPAWRAGSKEWMVYPGTGSGPSTHSPLRITRADGFELAVLESRCQNEDAIVTKSALDVDGDGVTDLVEFDGSARQLTVRRFISPSSGRQDRSLGATGWLTAIETEFGARYEIAYDDAKRDPSTRHAVPSAELVVSQVTPILAQNGGHKPLTPRRYDYGERAMYLDVASLVWRAGPYTQFAEIHGFERGEVHLARLRGPENPYEVATGTLFGRTEEVATFASSVWEGSFARRLRATPQDYLGLVSLAAAWPQEVTELRWVENTNVALGERCTGSPHPYLSPGVESCLNRSVVHLASFSLWSGSNRQIEAGLLRTVETDIDDLGRPVAQTITPSPTGDGSICTEINWAQGVPPYVRAKNIPAYTVTTLCRAGLPRLLSRTEWSYDNREDGRFTELLEHQITIHVVNTETGALERVERQALSYGPTGELTRREVAREAGIQSEHFVWDPFRLQPQLALLKQDGTTVSVTGTRYDPVTGLVVATQGPSGSVEYYRYDDRHRLTTVDHWPTDGPGHPILRQDVEVTSNGVEVTSLAFTDWGQAESITGDRPTPIVYVVKEGDSLWQIAGELLSDPLRWPEIVPTSSRIPQDHGQFTDPDLIYPGWVLSIPANTNTRPPAEDSPRDAWLSAASGAILSANRFDGFLRPSSTTAYIAKQDLPMYDGREALEIDRVQYDDLGRIGFISERAHAPTDPIEALWGTSMVYSDNGLDRCQIRTTGPVRDDIDTARQLEAEKGCVYTTYGFGRVLLSSPIPEDAHLPRRQATRYVSELDPLGNVVGERLVQPGVPGQPDHELARSSFGYDGLGSLTTFARFDGPDAEAAVAEWIFERDSSGAPLAVHEPGLEPREFDYGVGGELLKEYGPAGSSPIERSYDALGRLTEERVPTQAEPIVRQYSYYQGLEYEPGELQGALAGVRGNGLEASFRYDSLQRLSDAEYTTSDGSVFAESRRIGPAGHVLSRSMWGPTGQTGINSTFDTTGRLVSISSDAGHTLYRTESRAADGQPTRVRIGDDLIWTSGHASDGRPQSIQITGSDFAVGFGAVYDTTTGRLANRSIAIEAADTQQAIDWSYSYTSSGQLETAVRQNAAQTQMWTYSHDGKLSVAATTIDDGTSSVSATFAPDLNYLWCQSGDVCAASFDEHGNQVSYTAGSVQRTVDYDAQSTATRLSWESGTATVRQLATAGLVEVASEDEAGVLVTTEMGSIRRQRQRTTDAAALVIQSPIGMLSIDTGGRATVGVQGSTHAFALIDAEDSLRTVVDHDPYGAPNLVFGSDTGHFGIAAWNGGLPIGSSGLTLLGARLFEPSTSRFLQRDPILNGLAFGRDDPYLFSFGDPINFADPTGLSPCDTGADQYCAPTISELPEFREPWPLDPFGASSSPTGASYTPIRGFLPRGGTTLPFVAKLSPSHQRYQAGILSPFGTLVLGGTTVTIGTAYGAFVSAPWLVGALSTTTSAIVSAATSLSATAGAILAPAVLRIAPYAQALHGAIARLSPYRDSTASIRRALQAAAQSGGPTIRVITAQTRSPVVGRSLSVAVGPHARELARVYENGRTIYTADIPVRLLRALERSQLVRWGRHDLGGTWADEIRFMPAASEFIVQFFKPQ